ncbi:MAG: hypothetical protein AVDCRST_MAG24-1547, partial [uncultured Nocardioidaceae bacterium]
CPAGWCTSSSRSTTGTGPGRSTRRCSGGRSGPCRTWTTRWPRPGRATPRRVPASPGSSTGACSGAVTTSRPRGRSSSSTCRASTRRCARSGLRAARPRPAGCPWGRWASLPTSPTPRATWSGSGRTP